MKDHFNPAGARLKPPKLGPRSIMTPMFGLSGVPVELSGLGKANEVPLIPSRGTSESLLANDAFYTSLLKRTMIPRSVAIGTTPVKVITNKSVKGFLITNQLTSGISGTLFPSVSRNFGVGGGTFTSDPIVVAGYRELHLMMDVPTGGAGPYWDTYAQVKDPVSGNWADSQIVFTSVDTGIPGGAQGPLTGTYYAYLEGNGVAQDFRLRYSVLAGGVGNLFTASVGYILKSPLPGSGLSGARTIYIGSNNGIATTSGYPLIEGKTWAFFMEENSELWAVSEVATTLNILELQ
jgi:hypothetical protein